MGGSGAVDRVVVFQVDSGVYGMPLEQVVEVLQMVAITPVPDAPPWMAGVVNLRGEIIPMIDLRVRIGLPAVQPDLDHVFLVAAGAQRTVGVLADRVVDVIDVSASATQPPDRTTTPHTFVQGISRTNAGVVLILDLDRLASGSETAPVRPAPAPV